MIIKCINTHDSELIYVSPQELPLTLSLNLTNSVASASYVFFITINRICSSESECGYVPSFPSAFIDSSLTLPVAPDTISPNFAFGPMPFGNEFDNGCCDRTNCCGCCRNNRC